MIAKRFLKEILTLLGLSEWVTAYRNNRNYRSYYASNKREWEFYHRLSKMHLIFDIGANKGNKTDIFSALGRMVISVDPDERNYEILQSRFRFNPRVRIEKLALSDRQGEETFYVLDEGQELNTMSEKWKKLIESPHDHRFSDSRTFKKNIPVVTTTLDSLIYKYGIPDYVKIDVEGYELKVLKGLSHAVPMLSFESNLPEFLDETVACIEELHKLKENALFNISHDCNFMFREWMDAGTIKEMVKSLPLRTVEIYFKSA